MIRVGSVESAMQDMASKVETVLSQITQMLQTIEKNNTSTKTDIASKFAQLQQGCAKEIVQSLDMLGAQIQTLLKQTKT